jgi:hypothetical protein
MDVTEQDDESIKDWYSDATAIGTEYTVIAYPSLIFLSPEGKILQKVEGFKPVQKLVAVAKETLTPDKVYDDPYKEYKTLVGEFKKGIKKFDKMPYMIRTALKLNDSVVKEIFKEYLDYTYMLNENERYTKENIEIWSSFILKRDSKAIQFFLRDGDKIDQIMGQKGFSTMAVDNTIQGRIVDSFFKSQKGETRITTGANIPNSEIMFLRLPMRNDGKIELDNVEADWKTLEGMIRKYFNKDYATRNVLTARMRWYNQHQNFTEAAKMYFTKLDKWPPEKLADEMSSINQYAWQAFLYCNDKNLLKKTSKWQGKLIQVNSKTHELLDTYASLLYKLGKTNEAIKCEGKAITLTAPMDKKQQKIYRDVIEKMKKGEPTYLEEGAIWMK